MNKMEYKKFLEAVDNVCVNCLKLSEENCEHCPVRFTCDELSKKENLSMIVSGCRCIFNTMPNTELFKYNNTEVEVIRPLTDKECDIEDVGNMYKVRFYDGYERDAFEDELTKILF